MRTAAEWADENLPLPAGSSEPRYRSAKTPYVQHVAAAIASPLYEGVTFITASQMGKTQIILAIIGQRIDDDPVPIIYLGPTRNNVDTVIEPKLQHMFENVPTLDKYLVKGRAAQKLAKRCKGVTIRLAWAGSATEVAAQNAGLGLADEVDRMEDIPGEGDPLRALRKRTESYPDGKTAVTTTPTLGTVDTYIHEDTKMEHWRVADNTHVYSRSWLEWQIGTRHEWATPCLDCDRYFVARFRHIHCKIDEGDALTQAESARLCCPRCGYEHDDKAVIQIGKRAQPIAPGQWVEDGEVKGEPPRSKTYSLWVSGLFSPNNTLSGRMYDWITAKESEKSGQMQVEMNTGFGELWSVMGDSPSWSAVKDKEALHEKGTVPSRVNSIFLTVDVQKDRLEYVIRGWGYKKTSWLIDQGELAGDTEQPEVWDELAELFEAGIDGHVIDYMTVDARYRGTQVYDFVNRFPGQAFAIMGDSKGTGSKWWREAKTETDARGRRRRSSQQVWLLNGGFLKGFVFDRIKLKYGKPGGWYVYRDIEEDYCRQVTNEVRIPQEDGSYKWLKTGENHKLDCEYMQVFLALLKRTEYDFPSEVDEVEQPKQPLRRRRRRARVIESESA